MGAHYYTNLNFRWLYVEFYLRTVILVVGTIIMPSTRLSLDVGRIIRTSQYTHLKLRLFVTMETYAQIELRALNYIYSSKLLE